MMDLGNSGQRNMRIFQSHDTKRPKFPRKSDPGSYGLLEHKYGWLQDLF